MLRHQLPAYSPLSAAAVASGWGALLAGDRRHGLAESLGRTYGSRDVLLTDSATTALALAISAALKARPGAVALPAYGCFDLATAAITARAKVLLYDVDPSTLGPDFESLRRALTAGATVAAVAHQFAYPVDMREATQLTSAAGALLIEDAAQGSGGEYRGRPLGSLAPLAVLSFGRGKGMTGGGGGALLASADLRLEGLPSQLDEGDRGLRRMMMLTAQWLLGRPSLYGLPASLPFLGLGATHYRPPHPMTGMPPACAAVLAATWPLIESEVAIRRANAAWLEERLRPPLRRIHAVAEARPGYLRLPVLLPTAVAAAARDGGGGALGVTPGYPISLDALGALRAHGFEGETPAGAAELARTLVTLPTHGFVSKSDRADLEKWVAGITASP